MRVADDSGPRLPPDTGRSAFFGESRLPGVHVMVSTLCGSSTDDDDRARCVVEDVGRHASKQRAGQRPPPLRSDHDHPCATLARDGADLLSRLTVTDDGLGLDARLLRESSRGSDRLLRPFTLRFERGPER